MNTNEVTDMVEINNQNLEGAKSNDPQIIESLSEQILKVLNGQPVWVANSALDKAEQKLPFNSVVTAP